MCGRLVCVFYVCSHVVLSRCVLTFDPDLLVQVSSALSDWARKDNIIETPDSMFNYLIERVRNNLHIVLCMSPVGDPFR